MNTSNLKRDNVDHYLISQPTTTNKKLQQIRQTILSTCPDAVESISYGMPAYKYHKKPLIYFAAFAHHIGLYATPSANIAFAKELSTYKVGKGSIQLPLDQELPLDLIRQMIIFKIQEIDQLSTKVEKSSKR